MTFRVVGRIAILVLGCLVVSLIAEAQPAAKSYRIGPLEPGKPPTGSDTHDRTQ